MMGTRQNRWLLLSFAQLDVGFLVCFQDIDNRLNHNMEMKLQRAPSARAKVVSFPLECKKKEFYFPIVHSTSNNIVTRRARMTGNKKMATGVLWDNGIGL